MGKSISITTMTTSMDMTRSLRKDTTEAPTTFGWSVILLMLTLSGNVRENSSRTLSTFVPKATMSLSRRISTERITAERPL